MYRYGVAEALFLGIDKAVLLLKGHSPSLEPNGEIGLEIGTARLRDGHANRLMTRLAPFRRPIHRSASMFFRTKDGHALKANPFGAVVVPRPIAWIGTRRRAADGSLSDNLAPYSFFNAVAYTPPQLMFASVTTKDTLGNLLANSEAARAGSAGDADADEPYAGAVFSVNLVEASMAEKMNATSTMAKVDEWQLADVGKDECVDIDCPRVKDAPAALECRVVDIVRIKGKDNHIVIGEVIATHLREDCMDEDEHFDASKCGLVSRLGYDDYINVSETFHMPRPK